MTEIGEVHGAWPLWPWPWWPWSMVTWPWGPTWCCRWSCAPRWRAAGRGAQPGPGLQTLQPRSDRGHCHGHFGEHRTYTGAPVLQEPRVILVPDLENSLDMFPDEGPQHGPASRWRLCVVLRAAVRRLWSHGGGWEDGGGLAWACLYTASAQPSQTRAHGAAAALVLCIPQSGLFICKWLQINSFSSAGPLNALYELILSVKAAFLGLIFLQILWHVI